MTVERAQHLLKRARDRQDDLLTGFAASALSLAEEDEEVLHAEVLVEDAIEAQNRSSVAVGGRKR